MRLNFKILPQPAPLGTAVQLTAIDIIHGGFGTNQGEVVLVCGDGSESPVAVEKWLPFGVEVTLPSSRPAPGPFKLRVRTSPPLDEAGEADLEFEDPPV